MPEVWVVSAGFSDSDFARLKSRCWPAGFLSRDSRECIQIVGRIQFLGVVGLRYLFPCWLSTRVARSSWKPLSGLVSQDQDNPSNTYIWNLSKFSFFLTFFLPTAGGSSLLLRTLDDPRQYPYFKVYSLAWICKVPLNTQLNIVYGFQGLECEHLCGAVLPAPASLITAFLCALVSWISPWNEDEHWQPRIRHYQSKCHRGQVNNANEWDGLV